jgi:hypothetical protein
VESEPGLSLESGLRSPDDIVIDRCKARAGHFSVHALLPTECSCKEGTRVVEGRETWLWDGSKCGPLV